MTAWRTVPATHIHTAHQGLKHYVDGRPVTIISEDDDGYDYKFDDDPRGITYWVLHNNIRRTVRFDLC